MVAEQSDWGSSPAGIGSPPGAVIPKLEIRASKRAGMWANCGIDGGAPLVAGCSCSGQEGGIAVTVRHNFGTKKRTNFQDGIARYGFNTPIQSAHSGGAYTLRCDGSVHYVPYTIDRAVLNWLCIRDDGQVISN